MSTALARPAAFDPPFWARNAVLQTLMGQLATRTWGANRMLDRAKGELIRLSGGITLQGFSSQLPSGQSKGLVLMLSGWEGSANAPYMLCTGRTLYDAGYEVFRLNHLDHGDTHELSEALFHFGMVDKMYDGLQWIVSQIRTRPVFLLGFSMGGNFALHIAQRGLPGLKGVIAISPALDLRASMKWLANSPFNARFLKLWKKSLEKKAELFPHRYNAEDFADAQDLESVALEVLQAQGRKVSFEDYTAHYSVTPEKLRGLKAQTHIVASSDDPVLGPADYAAFEGVPKLRVWVQRYGGHVGFVSHPWGRGWYEDLVLSMLSEWDAATLE